MAVLMNHILRNPKRLLDYSLVLSTSFATDPHPQRAVGRFGRAAGGKIQHIHPVLRTIGDPAAIGRPGAKREGVGVEKALEAGERQARRKGREVALRAAYQV